MSLVSRLLIKASGAGDYWGDYEGVRCKVYFKGIPYQKEDDDRTYLSVETVKMDFSVKDITMGVENDNNNRVIRKFLSTHCLPTESVKIVFSFQLSTHRSGDELVHKFERSGTAEGNEASVEGEVNRSSSQLHGESFFENSV